MDVLDVAEQRLGIGGGEALAELARDGLRRLIDEHARNARVGDIVHLVLENAHFLFEAAGVGEAADVAEALDELAHRRFEIGRGLAAGAGDHERFDGIEPRQQVLLDARIGAFAGKFRVQFGDGVGDGAESGLVARRRRRGLGDHRLQAREVDGGPLDLGGEIVDGAGKRGEVGGLDREAVEPLGDALQHIFARETGGVGAALDLRRQRLDGGDDGAELVGAEAGTVEPLDRVAQRLFEPADVALAFQRLAHRFELRRQRLDRQRSVSGAGAVEGFFAAARSSSPAWC